MDLTEELFALLLDKLNLGKTIEFDGKMINFF